MSDLPIRDLCARIAALRRERDEARMERDEARAVAREYWGYKYMLMEGAEADQVTYPWLGETAGGGD